MKTPAILLFAALALFGAACSSQTTVETDTAAPVAAEAQSTDEAESAAAEPAAAAQSTDDTETAPPASTQSVDETEAEASRQDDPAASESADEAPDSTEADSTAAPAPDLSAVGSGDWCGVASQVEESFGSGLDPFSDEGSFEELFTTSAELMNQAVSIAPPAIAGDVAVAAEAANTMIGLLEDADWDFLTVDFARFEELTAGMETAGFNISKYNFEVCGIGEDPDLVGLDALDELEEFDVSELLDNDAARGVMEQTLSGFGLEADESACVVEAWSALGFDDPLGMVNAMEQCNVPLDAIVGGG